MFHSACLTFVRLIFLLLIFNSVGVAEPIASSTRTGSNQLAIDHVKNTRADMPTVTAASIGGTVYFDVDNDRRFDRQKDRPVVGASVMADGQTTVSRRDGSYLISDLATGRQLLLVTWPGGQKTRIALDLYAEHNTRIVNIGTGDKTQMQPAAPVNVMAAVPRSNKTPAAAKAVRPIANPYAPSPLTGEAYTALVTSRPNIPQEPLVKTTGQSSPANNSFQRTYVVPSPHIYSGSTPIAGTHLGGYSTGDAQIDSYIVDSGRRYGIDPLLVYAQMGQESSYKKRALSVKGARGLMQLMPATARRMGVTNIYDPKQNIEGGVKYMRLLMNMFDGDLKLALAGYNAGEGAVIRYGYQIPPYNETRDYVRRISAHYRDITRQTLARTGGSVPVKMRPAFTNNGVPVMARIKTSQGNGDLLNTK